MRHKVKHVHFVGVGGSGMSGIAEVMLNLGYQVSGSGLSDTSVTQRLTAQGVRVCKGHAAANIAGADAVVVSSAVKEDNPEVVAARAQGVPVVWVQHESEDLPRGSAKWQWVPELVPREGEPRVDKRFNSGFEDSTLERVLADLGATHLVLAGAETNWCIRATAYGALERGYDLTLVSDAHTATPIEIEPGRPLDIARIVEDLNLGMTWLRYPGRKNRTACAAELDFAALG